VTQLGRWFFAAFLLVLGLAMLGFTACGLFFGISLLINNGAPVAWMGFVCAVIGFFALRPIYSELKELWPQLQTPKSGSMGNTADKSDDAE
jgi:hypothetical protein